MNYAQKERQDFIAMCLAKTGRINRSDLITAFEISTSQAAIDLRTFQKCRPGQMRYDKSRRAYVPTYALVWNDDICTPEEKRIKYYEDLLADITLRLVILKMCEGGPTREEICEFLEHLENQLLKTRQAYS